MNVTCLQTNQPLMKKLLFCIALFIAFSANAQNAPTDTLDLEDLVFVGFSKEKKVNLTGSVSQVNMQQVLGDRPINSIGAALQGAIPGLSISGVSSPGQPKNFNIRGTLSINGGVPLILIDNIEGDINSLNPEDIESISVLKDAASSAIYGARAAGGVILVTTKHPEKNQPLRLEYGFNLGFERSIANPQQASLDDYIAAYKEAGFSSLYWAGNGSISRWQELLGQYRQGSLSGVYDNGVYKDADGAVYYLKEGDVLGNALESGFMSSHNISAAGGSEHIRYRISGSYNYENGPMVSSKDAFSRKSLNAFISSDVNDWFTQEASIIYTSQNKSEILTVFRDPYSIRLINWYPEGYMPKEITGTAEDLLIDSPRNACLYQPAAKSVTSTPRIALKSIITPMKNLTLTAEYTYLQKDYRYNSYTGQAKVVDPQLSIRNLPATGMDKYVYNVSSDKYNALNLYGQYSLRAKGHNINTIIGFNQESESYKYLNNTVLGQTVITVPSIQGASGTKTSTEGSEEYSVRGVFGRLAYNFEGRYLLEMNARYDGSSKFPKDNRFGLFPSVSAAWRLGDESFMNWSRSVVNDLKLRASWGSIGNQSIAPYGFIAGMNVSESKVWIDKAGLVNVISTPGLIRANYTWETVKTLNFGLDLSAFSNRLSLVFDKYIRNTEGMLSDGIELPGVVGATAPLQNVSNMRTDGWELSINWRDNAGDLGYRLGFNLYDHKSRITKYNNASNNLNYYYEGKMLGEIWGYVSDGYYSIDDFDAEKAQNGIWELKEGIPSLEGYIAKPGDVKFVDLDGNGTINSGSNTLDEAGDRKIIGNSTPRFEFGASFGLSWKGFDFSMILQGVGKRDYNLNTAALFTFGSYDQNERQFFSVYSNQTDYWTAKSYDPQSPEYMVAANPDAKLPRIYGQLENATSNMRVSDRYLQNAAYLRIKNATLSYSFPKSLLVRTKAINSLRVYASCENLATFTSLPKGYDPELLRWGYPFYRTCSFGVNITF